MQIYKDKFCVYVHSIDGVVFYVGKGDASRPFLMRARNSRWTEYTARLDSFDVLVIAWFDSNSEALECEKILIKRFNPFANVTHTDNPKKPGKDYSPFSRPLRMRENITRLLLKNKLSETPLKKLSSCELTPTSGTYVYSLRAVADGLGVTMATAQKWVVAGVLPGVKIGNFWRVSLHEFRDDSRLPT